MKQFNMNGDTGLSPISYHAFKLGYGDYIRFRDLVLERSGLHFPEKKWPDLEIGLAKALQSVPAAVIETVSPWDIDTYYHFLKAAASLPARMEMNRLINLLTIGETHFFRDSAQFDALTTQVLPNLIARKRAAAAAIGSDPPGIPQLRLWSAGCASGEEPYSLAILLHQLIPDIKNWQILILATDINHESLARAQQAHYSDWSFRETRAKSNRSFYFTLQHKRYHLRDDIRRMVTFMPLNLIEDNIPAIHNNTVSMDLIICRNVTIYFTEETTRHLVNKFYQALVEGGWLVVGHAELSLVIYRAFQARLFPDTVFYQKTGQATPWPADWTNLDSTPKGSPGITAQPFVSTSQPEVSSPQFAFSEPDNKLLSPPAPQKQPSSTFKVQPSTAPTEPNPYQIAQRQLSQGHSHQAIVTLEGQLETLPEETQPPAYCLLARAYANQGHWSQARHWADKAIARDALSLEAYYTLALICEHEGDSEQAIIYLKKVIYLGQEEPLPHFNLATLYKKRGQIAAARRAFNNVIRILEQRPGEEIIPDSGGDNATTLLQITQRALKELAGPSTTAEI